MYIYPQVKYHVKYINFVLVLYISNIFLVNIVQLFSCTKQKQITIKIIFFIIS